MLILRPLCQYTPSTYSFRRNIQVLEIGTAGVSCNIMQEEHLLPPAYVVRREGNVLTRVCLSVHRGGGQPGDGSVQPEGGGGGSPAGGGRGGVSQDRTTE